MIVQSSPEVITVRLMPNISSYARRRNVLARKVDSRVRHIGFSRGVEHAWGAVADVAPHPMPLHGGDDVTGFFDEWQTGGPPRHVRSQCADHGLTSASRAQGPFQ